MMCYMMYTIVPSVIASIRDYTTDHSFNVIPHMSI